VGPAPDARLLQPVADHNTDPAPGGLLELGVAFTTQEDDHPGHEQDETDPNGHRHANFVF
jgi:hypothetical protein